MEINSSQRAYLKGLAMTMDPIAQIGKESLTDNVIKGIDEVVKARELIKVSVLKNCDDDVTEIARVVADRTGSVLVQVIGRKFVLYRPADDPKDRKIELPKR